MYKISVVTIPELLNKKFLEWQYQQNTRKTLDDFAEYIGVKRPLLSMWMNGARVPGEANKSRLIELFGTDAILAFGEDPDLYYVKENWNDLPQELRHSIREQAEQYQTKNEPKRAPKKRGTTAP